MSRDLSRPNVILALADTLGWGELGCYGGGLLRSAASPRIDKLATKGLPPHNFNVESDCVPTRSALMTGRHPIRTGCRYKLLDHLESLGKDIHDNTVFIFTSDNRLKFHKPYWGTAGPWSGAYHTAMEGSLRMPFIIRWPGLIPEGVTSNEIVHVTDIFTTIIFMTG
ncbi:alkaline-phosphatase-like protein [Dactylonectria macrodidyma]|uniref:Alkaline-phosphatase-like protein n=1 Tax=Dactylonectria macrodidyma TaxID=307937 RepID=A0A9P9I989_9HYPO|nr:alkaline-phosphatase-like protein [Dactylonectria macrodidyma]